MQEPQAHHPLWKRLYLAPSYHADETRHVYALQVLAEILAGESVGRLYQNLVMKKRLATEIGVGYLPDSVSVTEFALHALPARGVEVTTLAREVTRELEVVAAKGVSSTEVRRAQHRLQRDAIWARKHRHDMPEKLGVALITGRTLTDVERWPARLATVTPEQVQEAARAILREECAVTGMLLPPAVGKMTGDEGRWLEKP